MHRAFHGSYAYLAFAACMCAWLPIEALVHAVHRRDEVPRIEGRWLRRLARVVTRASRLWRFSVEGQPPPDIGTRGYVVVANHQSNADAFLLSYLPWDMRWIAKRELFGVPVVGWLLRLSGDIPVRRGDRESAERMHEQARDTLERGLSVMIFPEGTRSRDGHLQPFKDGAFRLAIEAHAPVLPIVVRGTRDCMPKDSRWLGEARASARVLEPIDTRDLGPGDVGRLRDRVHARIAEAL